MAQRRPSLETTPTRPLVLLVDDDADTREMYSEYLSAANYNVAQASDAGQAVAQVTTLHPNIVVMDFSLPKITGAEVCRRLKANRRTRQIPVIMLSGWPVSDEDVYGCDAFLMKPCLPSDLLIKIDGLLGNAGDALNSSAARNLRARSSKLRARTTQQRGVAKPRTRPAAAAFATAAARRDEAITRSRARPGSKQIVKTGEPLRQRKQKRRRK